MMVERRVAQDQVVLTTLTGILQISTLAGNSLLVKLTGGDDGSFGMTPFDDLEHLISRMKRPDLFIDTSAATSVSAIATDQWTKWLGNQKRSLGRVHILSTGKFFLIAASIMRELSQARDQIRIYSSAADFQAAIPQFERGTPVQNPVLFSQSNFSGDETFQGAKSRIRIQRMRPGVLFIMISGFDDGETLESVLKAISSEVESYSGKTRIFIDASHTSGVAVNVSDAWTDWIRAHQDKISGVVLLSNNRLVTLVVSAAKIFSRTGNLINIAENQSTFDQKLQQSLPR